MFYIFLSALSCGESQTGTSGYLTVPGDYSSSSGLCLWTIRVNPGDRIALDVIQDLDVAEEDCSKSYVAIWDGIGTMGKVQKKICGDSDGTGTIVSNGNAMTVELRALCMGTRRFRATWRSLGSKYTFLFTELMFFLTIFLQFNIHPAV